MFDLTITRTNAVGILLTLVGGVWYAAVEYQEKKRLRRRWLRIPWIFYLYRETQSNYKMGCRGTSKSWGLKLEALKVTRASFLTLCRCNGLYFVCANPCLQHYNHAIYALLIGHISFASFLSTRGSSAPKPPYSQWGQHLIDNRASEQILNSWRNGKY